MYLTRHLENGKPRWALDSRLLPEDFSLSRLLQVGRDEMMTTLQGQSSTDKAGGRLLAPIDDEQEIWASGVTYITSREARMAESESKDVYKAVYDAERPELFYKASGWRVVGPNREVRLRKDSRWNVPEPELTLLINKEGEVVGYTAGNDMSSRDIEGANPLYLPQAKVYNKSCAIGPGIVLATPDEFRDLNIRITVVRDHRLLFEERTQTSRMKRSYEDLARYLTSELEFPYGVFLMTGTGIVPKYNFTLLPRDEIRIEVGKLTLDNRVAAD